MVGKKKMISTSDGPGGLCLGTVGLVPLVLSRAGSGGLLSMAMRLETELGLSWGIGLRAAVVPCSAAPGFGGRLGVCSYVLALRCPCPHGLPTWLA